MIQLPSAREKKPVVIGRIILIEQHVASNRTEGGNPYELAEGTEFYVLTVERVPDEHGNDLDVLDF